MLAHPLGYIYIPPKSSFGKGGLRRSWVLYRSRTPTLNKKATRLDGLWAVDEDWAHGCWRTRRVIFTFLLNPPLAKEDFGGRESPTPYITIFKQKKRHPKRTAFSFFELLMRIELTTSSLPRKCSTPELQQQLLSKSGAKVENKFHLSKYFDHFLSLGEFFTRRVTSVTRVTRVTPPVTV